jgi:hypothetical protein
VEVDKHIHLSDILKLPEDWQTQHRIRALVVGDRCPAYAGLVDLERDHVEDYKKLKKVLRLVGTCDRVRNEQHVKRSGLHREVYEMRGGNARLFFFYTPDEEEVVVCMNVYRKRKSSRAEQNEAFAIAERLRQAYIASRERGS